jgi:hypothetical protein
MRHRDELFAGGHFMSVRHRPWVYTLVAVLCVCAAAPAADDAVEKAATSARLLIRKKDYDGACDEGLGNTAGALAGYAKALERLDASGGDPELRRQALAGVQRLDEGYRVVAGHADQMEAEARRLRAKNERSADVVMRAVQTLRDELLGTAEGGPGAADERPARAGARPAGRTPADGGRAKARPAQPAKVAVVSRQEFRDKYAKSFPLEGNLARGGRAAASGTHGEMDDPTTALGGGRKYETWALNNDKGWFQAEWPESLVGRYIIVFNRPGGIDADPWDSGTLEVNGRQVATVGSFVRSQVLVIDLGEPVAIRSVRVTIQGRTYPGLSGLEIHRAPRG